MDNVIRLSFLGDVMCLQEQILAIKKSGKKYDVIFDQVKHLWAESDYVVANLETPVAGWWLRYSYENMRFNAPDELARAIKNAGISFVSLANNHVLDRGVKGLNNTIKTLDLLGLEHSGAYKTKEDSERIFTKTIKGVRIAFISCTYGVNQGLRCSFLPDDDLWKVDILKYPDVQITSKSFLIKRFISNLIPYSLKKRMRRKRKMTFTSVPDSVAVEEFDLEKNKLYLRRILDKIKLAKKISDFVIVLPHIGGQYCTEPGPWQRKITEAFISAGADLIISNHAHMPLPIEVRRNVLISHGLGDFCSYLPEDDDMNKLCYSSNLLNIEIDKVKKALLNYSIKKVRMDNLNGVTYVKHEVF